MVKLPQNFYNLSKFANDMAKAVINNFMKGVMRASKAANRMPPQVNKRQIENLTAMVSDSIKGITDEMSKNIRRVIRDGINEGITNQQIADNLDEIFKGDNPTRFHYEDRLRMISRTESTRELNSGGFETANKLGATGKYIDIVDDNRTSDVSRAMFEKYGSPEKAIPVDEEFFVFVRGKEYRGMFPPFMPNDRDMVLFTFD